jgi:hypothetical protein
MSNIFDQYATTLSGLEGLEGYGDEDALAGLDVDELGARAKLRRRAQGGNRVAAQQLARQTAGRAGGVQAMPVGQLMAPISGVPSRGLRKSWTPMGSVIFAAASGTALPLTVQPQKPFRPTRMVFDTARTGATATGLVTLTDLSIGQNRQPAAPGAAPLGAFAPNSFDVDVDLDPANTSINVRADLAISVAPGAADTVAVSGLLIGYMIG